MEAPVQMNIEKFAKLMESLKSKKDCPAAPICIALGTSRTDCLAGGDIMANQSQFCLVSIVALLGHISGITLKPTPSKKIAGFSEQDHSASKKKSKTSSKAH